MKKWMYGAAMLQAGLLLIVAGPALAQDKASEVYSYVTYSVCDLTKQDRLDQIFEELDKPILDAAVADGTIMAYGYNAHHTGGRWRRASFTTASSIQGLLDAQVKIGDATEAKNKKLADEATAICGQHDDYIWRRIAGTAGTAASGKAVFSTYYVCDGVRETEADALVQQVIAPVLDKLVTEGKLKTWGWLEHIVGGQFRRLETMSAADNKSLMEARAAVIDALTDNPVGDTFTAICDSHADYIWERKSGNP